MIMNQDKLCDGIMKLWDTIESQYGMTPEQLHAGIDKLWKALGITTVQDEDVFTLAARRIEERNV